ncbi:FMR1-interacting protein NUFIP2 isoform X2 [Bombina bombina]|uniref:FMR1-interacting protein NUFIP2 isoform X2 n=1 Tax=Bombina bombina TaxID=8345 RepID=UPI00235AF333|nr:FMR1-interacting protein NUFIP2 isoform X2 [Bombina bombina]
MEEQPGQHHHHSPSSHSYYYYCTQGQQQYHHNYQQTPKLQHGAEGSAKPQSKPLKHEQKHALQHQETHQKKTGHGELNGTAGERYPPPKTLGSDKAANQTASRVSNGNQQVVVDTNINPKQQVKAHNFGKAGSKTKTLLHKNSMDKKNEKSYESKTKDTKCTDKGEVGPFQNGLLANNSGYITNGYVSKCAENDGSGSESGYATPKKRKDRCNNVKGAGGFNSVMDKTTDTDVKLESESSKPDPLVDQKGGGRMDNAKASWKCDSGMTGASRGKPNSADVQRKNSDVKPLGSKKFDDRPKGKVSPAASSKEDSWTLFKPPPAFPVDNSSAKIVPKISYASKVKENLNKAAQNNSASSSLAFSPVAGEVINLNCVSQVPMSAMKSVSTVNFPNGPLLAGADLSSYLPAIQPLLATAASTVSHTLPGGAESFPTEAASALTPCDQKKSSLFMYPSNMQQTLPTTTQGDLSGQANQHSLGEIFQNQWGLSFINEPSAGPEAGVAKPTCGQITWEGAITSVSQGAEVVASGNERPVFPKAYELEKRTSPQVPDGASLKVAHGSGVECTGLSSEPQQIVELQKTDSSQVSLVFQAKVYEMEVPPRTSLTNTLQTSAKDKRYLGGLEWGSNDLKAAILYHTKEMESIFILQKQV